MLSAIIVTQDPSTDDLVVDILSITPDKSAIQTSDSLQLDLPYRLIGTGGMARVEIWRQPGLGYFPAIQKLLELNASKRATTRIFVTILMISLSVQIYMTLECSIFLYLTEVCVLFERVNR